MDIKEARVGVPLITEKTKNGRRTCGPVMCVNKESNLIGINVDGETRVFGADELTPVLSCVEKLEEWRGLGAYYARRVRRASPGTEKLRDILDALNVREVPPPKILTDFFKT